MYDICCVGHLTSDKIVTPKTTIYMAGGTAFYFSYAVCSLDVKYLLMTALAEDDLQYVDRLRGKGIEIKVQRSTHTVFFENIYGDNPDIRTQNVLAKADPFAIEPLQDIKAQIFHLGPLLADDMSTDFIKAISKKGKVSLDAQGYLRKVENQKVLAVDWSDKTEALQYIDILKVDEAEMTVLTGYKEVSDGAKLLVDWGVKEVVITNGSMGSTIYCDSTFYNIPAYRPKVIVDATGCGDTYMGGYLYQRVKGKGIQESGEFAAAIASLKMEAPGAFKGTEQDIMHRLSQPF